MIRKTVLGLAAAAVTLGAAMSASTTSASAHGYGYYKPYYCKKVIVGYNYYGHPIWRCVKRYHRYGYGY
jgi:hypothetical protein